MERNNIWYSSDMFLDEDESTSERAIGFQAQVKCSPSAALQFSDE